MKPAIVGNANSWFEEASLVGLLIFSLALNLVQLRELKQRHDKGTERNGITI